MYRKWLWAAMAAIMLLLLGGCAQDGLRGPSSAEEVTALERIHQMLVSMHSFRAIATVEYRSNKGSNIYETVQHARITGEYRIEVTGPTHVAGSVTASDGRTTVQFNSRVNGRVSVTVEENPERSEVFLTTFIRNYLQCNEISLLVAEMEEGVRTVLETTVPGNHPYLATARLWVDNTTLLPVKLVIFDAEGAERIIVTYHVFEYNITLEDGLFSL